MNDTILMVLVPLVFGSYLFTAAITKWLSSRIEELVVQVFNHNKHAMDKMGLRIDTLESNHVTENIEQRVNTLESNHATENIEQRVDTLETSRKGRR